MDKKTVLVVDDERVNINVRSGLNYFTSEACCYHGFYPHFFMLAALIL